MYFAVFPLFQRTLLYLVGEALKSFLKVILCVRDCVCVRVTRRRVSLPRRTIFLCFLFSGLEYANESVS